MSDTYSFSHTNKGETLVYTEGKNILHAEVIWNDNITHFYTDSVYSYEYGYMDELTDEKRLEIIHRIIDYLSKRDKPLFSYNKIIVYINYKEKLKIEIEKIVNDFMLNKKYKLSIEYNENEIYN